MVDLGQDVLDKLTQLADASAQASVPVPCIESVDTQCLAHLKWLHGAHEPHSKQSLKYPLPFMGHNVLHSPFSKVLVRRIKQRSQQPPTCGGKVVKTAAFSGIAICPACHV